MTIGKKTKYYIFSAVIVLTLYSVVWAVPAPKGSSILYDRYFDSATTSESEKTTDVLTFPPDTGNKVDVPQPNTNPLDESGKDSPFTLQNPPGVGTTIEYDPETNTYNFQYMTGSTPYGPGANMDINEFIDYDLRKETANYWKEKGVGYKGGGNRRGGGGIIPQLKIGGDVFESIFGSNVIDIRPSGSAELIFGVIHRTDQNPNIPVKQRRRTNFNFDQNIQLNLLAKIGDKIEFNLNYNTEANFDFETEKIKLKYEGKEDDIIQLLEFGNVSLPLNSSLITGSQSLFGIKTQLKFGNLTVTAVASEQTSETKTITVTGGAQTNEFYFKADEYEENKHYFIGQYFRDHYNKYLETLPLVGSPIVITKIEVWRTTIGAATTENRNIVAFTDLGEAHPQFQGFQYVGGNMPDNGINNLTSVVDSSLIRDISTIYGNMRSLGLTSGIDYEKVESARLLSSSEYTFNSKLGFISLNSALGPDQVLAVAFQYTVIGDNKVYQVGEFSNEVSAPSCLRVKLLKSTTLDTKSTLWKLMMKNVYSLSAYQISPDKFRLNVLYKGDEAGIANGFFDEGAQKGIPLIRLMGLDRLNQQMDPFPDGIFDFIDGAATTGGTINAANGRVYFPKIEPFGKDLQEVLTDPVLAAKYAFDSLYTTTKTIAQQFTDKNKYYIEGSYKSSYGSEYSLNAMNVPEGSVKVTAGGIPLIENIDYTVNYSMGSISILNEGILNSGTPISITVEDNASYAAQKRRMFGANLDYQFSKNFNIGATILNLRERPITQKVNYGDEPINNVIWGMNFAYKSKVPFITKLVDFLPFHSTTAESNFSADGEFAHFIPGHSRAIGKVGITYIDDFESSKSSLDLRSYVNWILASTPQGQYDIFPEARPVSESDNDRKKLAYGFNRAILAWYIIDPLFYNNNNATPRNLTKEDLSKPYARAVYEPELFPYKERQSTAESTYMSVFNMAFYPTERGPYNFDVDGREGLSSGINDNGSLRNPETRWGGIMRKMDNPDFEAANYEYIEFWMMDPFIENAHHKGGKLYFNLGDVSEDVLRDGYKLFENGLPADGSDLDVEFTVWGRVPTTQLIVRAFDNNGETARKYQDVGYDGLQDERERTYFTNNYLEMLSNVFGTSSEAYNKAYGDPSADNFHYFRGTDYDDENMKVVERYKKYNNPDGNSPTDAQSHESYPTAGTNLPNVEDVNNDNTLSEDEKYYQYVIDLAPENMVVGKNYINDIYDAIPDPLPDGSRPTTRWYQFRIPIKNPDKTVGNISGFNSIRFLRVFMRDFYEPIICRLATFELVRSDWRTYQLSLMQDGDYIPSQGDGNTSFYVGTVSYEENANRVPIPYVLPAGIEREQGAGTTQIYLVNEQSLSLKAVDLGDGDARAIYKNTAYDLRQFKKMEMLIHGEDVYNSGDLKKGDVTVFIRIGNDLTENYYEYELPIEFTPWGVGQDSARIWPKANRMMIVLDSLVSIKQRRNIEIRRGTHPNNLLPYVVELADGNKITIVGMPNLGDVNNIMIGIRNPKKQTANDGDDMLPKSVEVWINELRLAGFDDKSGFAALARMRLNLADVGDLTLSGTYSTPGFGSLEQSVTERQMETKYSVDFATNIDGGKVLFPEKWNMKIPVHYDYSLNMSIPEYNPLNPDVELKSDLKTYETKGERDSIKRMTTSRIQRQNINLMNVRKERNFDKPLKIRPWDIENLDFSYSYSEVKKSDVDVEFDNEINQHGELGYTFNHNPKNYRPLASVKGLKSKWLQIIKDFNFYVLPKSFIFRTSVTRGFAEFKLRPKSQGNIIIDTSYVKNFEWNRDYTLNWDIAQSLKFEYSARASARIDEPEGRIDQRVERDSVWRSFGQGGRTTYFNQKFNASWQIPINKIPLFNWLSANVRYTSDYVYTASAMSLAYLGNTIQNSNTIQGNGSVNFVTLYNNIPYLKKVNQGVKKAANSRSMDSKKKEDEKKNTDKKEGKKKDKDNRDSLKNKNEIGRLILDGTVRFLMLVRNASLSYSEGNGTVLPGYMHSPNLFGINFATNSPGFAFVFGGQPDIRKLATDGHWLTTDSLMNSAFESRYNQTVNFRATVEPFRDFRIDITANRNYTQNFTEYFRSDANGVMHHYSPQTTGSFSMTFVGLSSFFSNSDQVFSEFREVRKLLASRISENNPNSNGRINPETGYPVGYGELSQDVLTAAFLAAYGGRNPDKMDVSSQFPKIPLPNWRLNYTGFTKIKGVNKIFQSLSLLHTYTSSYSVGNYTTNILYTSDAEGNPNTLNTLGNFIPTKEFAQVSLSEQFNPLIGFDMTLKNSLLLKVEYKKSRNVAMSFSNNQITESSSDEFVFSTGYRFKDLKIGFVFSGMKRQVVSDLNLTAGFGLKKNLTLLRKIDEDTKQISAGMLTITINVAADYQISSMVGLRLYYDQVINRPELNNQYDNMNFETGISVRLMLTQ